MNTLNKKAMNSYDIVYWSVRILFVLIMLFFFYFLASVYENTILDTTHQEAQIFVRYMLYNPNALSYVDDIGRSYPGIVVVSNFNSERLEKAMSFGTENNIIAAIITLYNASNNVVIASTYYNKDKYDSWLPLSSPTFTGAGKVNKTEEKRYVIYDNNNQRNPGFIQFEILVPRT